MAVDREIHYQGDGVQALSDRLETAIQAGDAQEAANASFLLGCLRVFSLIGIPFLQENVRKRKLQAGHREVCEQPEQVQRAIDIYRDLLAKNPRMKKGTAERKAFEVTRVPIRTIQRHKAKP